MSGVVGSRQGRGVCGNCGKKGMGAPRTEYPPFQEPYQSRNCQYCGHRVTTPKSPAGGDAIPSGKREGWQKNLAGVKNGSDCYRTIDGVRWFWEPTPPALLKGTSIRHRAAPEGNSFVHPDDIDKLDAHLNGATPKPPAGGDAGAVATIISDYCRDGVKPEPFDGPLDTADLAATAILAALALPAPVVEADSPYVAGPIWAEEEDDCFTAEIQISGGHYVVATVHGATRDQVEQRQRAIIAALSEGRSHG